MPNEHQRTFFTTLGTLEDEILVRGVNAVGEVYNERVKSFLEYLVRFVKEANWTDSVSSKLICKYYRESDKALCEYWKSCYGKAKSEHTFRSQRATLGKTLEGMFGSRSHVEEVFMSNDPENEDLKEIVLRIRTFSLQDLNLSDFLDCQTLFELTAKLPISSDKEIDIKTCEKEVMFLAGRSSYNLDACIEALDKNKLGYICNLLKVPLFHKGQVNDGKVALLNMLHSGMKDTSSLESTMALNDFMKANYESIDSGVVSTKESVSVGSHTDDEYNALLAERNNLQRELNALKEQYVDVSEKFRLYQQSMGSDVDEESAVIKLDALVDRLDDCNVDADAFLQESCSVIEALETHNMVIPTALYRSLDDYKEVDSIEVSSSNYVTYKVLLMLVCMFDVGTIANCVPRVAESLNDDGTALGYLKHFLLSGESADAALNEISEYIRHDESFMKGLAHVFFASEFIQTDSVKYRNTSESSSEEEGVSADISDEVEESQPDVNRSAVVTSFSDDDII